MTTHKQRLLKMERILFENSESVTEERVAQHFLSHSSWNNTSLTVADVLSQRDNKNFAQYLFNNIVQNSDFMSVDLLLIKKEWALEFIANYEVPTYNEQYLNRRIRALRKYYNIE